MSIDLQSFVWKIRKKDHVVLSSNAGTTIPRNAPAFPSYTVDVGATETTFSPSTTASRLATQYVDKQSNFKNS